VLLSNVGDQLYDEFLLACSIYTIADRWTRDVSDRNVATIIRDTCYRLSMCNTENVRESPFSQRGPHFTWENGDLASPKFYNTRITHRSRHSKSMDNTSLTHSFVHIHIYNRDPPQSFLDNTMHIYIIYIYRLFDPMPRYIH